jgi:hypothetical protein
MSNMSKLYTNAADCSCHHFWYDFPTTYSAATNTKIISTVQTLIIHCSNNEIFLLGI